MAKLRKRRNKNVKLQEQQESRDASAETKFFYKFQNLKMKLKDKGSDVQTKTLFVDLSEQAIDDSQVLERVKPLLAQCKVARGAGAPTAAISTNRNKEKTAFNQPKRNTGLYTNVKLNLSDNHITYPGCVNLATFIHRGYQNEEFPWNLHFDINLAYNSIESRGVSFIADHLLYNDVLSGLNLSWNNVGPTGAQSIATAIMEQYDEREGKSASSLTFLALKNASLIVNDPQEACAEQKDTPLQPSDLALLEMLNINSAPSHSDRVSPSRKTTKQEKTLECGNGAEALLRVLPYSNLKILLLNDNQITGDDMRCLLSANFFTVTANEDTDGDQPSKSNEDEPQTTQATQTTESSNGRSLVAAQQSSDVDGQQMTERPIVRPDDLLAKFPNIKRSSSNNKTRQMRESWQQRKQMLAAREKREADDSKEGPFYYVNSNNEVEVVSKSDIRRIQRQEARFCALTELNMNGNLLGLPCVDTSNIFEHWQSLLAVQKLQRLCLNKNSIQLSGIQAIARNIIANNSAPKLKELHLDGNAIGDAGVLYIADAMCSNSVITKLSLSDNGIECDGSVALSDAIKKSRSTSVLSELNLSFNQIADRGSEALIQLVREACESHHRATIEMRKPISLAQLFMHHNNIPTERFSELLDALRDLSSVIQCKREERKARRL